MNLVFCQSPVINGKRNSSVHSLRCQFDVDSQTIALRVRDRDNWTTFNLSTEQNDLENWLSDYFAIPVHLKQNHIQGFPDDTVSLGPTIVSTATLEAIASWYPGLDVEEVRLRFRANIEIAGVPAFWEDRLFGQVDTTVNFQIGDVRFMGVNPCQRCVVITRNPHTGEAYPNFQKTFTAKRKETLPEWVEKSRFNHFYRLAINTRLPATEVGKQITLQDIVKF